MNEKREFPWWSYEELVEYAEKIILTEVCKGSIETAAHRLVQGLMNIGVEKGRRLERGEKPPE